VNRSLSLQPQASAAPAPDSSVQALNISFLGARAVLFEAPGLMDLSHQRRIWSMARRFADWPGISETVPGMTNLMLSFKTPPTDIAGLHAALREAWEQEGELQIEGRCIELPVVYGGDGGPHLGDVVAHTGLSVDEIIHLHAAPLYTVYALGSHPGYCYLGGMDERIATPRRKVPVVRLPGGSVSIGGAQTGVSASPGPSGWSTIGHTEMVFFDPSRAQAATLAPGDSIRFRIAKVLK
jgi:KipI family sensor histidine kinase inhibitor